MLHGHGDDAYLYRQTIKVNFSSNVNYTGAHTALRAYISEHFDTINNYPEPGAESLQSAIAVNHNLETQQVIITNGATEAFYLIAQAYGATSATIMVPTFSEYEDACKLNNIAVQFIKDTEISISTLFNSNLVFICNPNNPTGKTINQRLLKNVIGNNARSLFIVDEAYIDFTQQITSLAGSIGDLPNLIIVKSLTKTYAIPGLRLGYLIGNKNITSKIATYKMPWSVNALAIAAGNYIIKHQHVLQPALKDLLQDTQALINQLNALPHIIAHSTDTHYFLCETKKMTAADLKDFLIINYGLLIRDAGNFTTLSAQHFRIATQTVEQNELLINALRAWKQ